VSERAWPGLGLAGVYDFSRSSSGAVGQASANDDYVLQKSADGRVMCYCCRKPRSLDSFVILRGDGRKPYLFCVQKCSKGSEPVPEAEIEALFVTSAD